MVRQVTSFPVIEKTVANGNWDTSRVNPIDRIIIHTMVGTAEAADARFNNSTSHVSAHYGVLEDGTIWHWVDEDNTAYHAGNYPMNQRSIGIEHEDYGDYNGIRPDSLYNSSAKLVHDICSFYQIPIDRTHILKHSEVIATGCPDALDIDKIVSMAASMNGLDPLSQCNLDRDINWNIVIAVSNKLGINADSNNKPQLQTNLLQKVDDLNNQNAELQKQFEDYKTNHPSVILTGQNSGSTTTIQVPSQNKNTSTSIYQVPGDPSNSSTVQSSNQSALSDVISFLKKFIFGK